MVRVQVETCPDFEEIVKIVDVNPCADCIHWNSVLKGCVLKEGIMEKHAGTYTKEKYAKEYVDLLKTYGKRAVMRPKTVYDVWVIEDG